MSKSRFNLFEFNPDPTARHTFWTLVFGAVFQYFYAATTQAGVQRINSTPSISAARKLLYIAAPIYSLTWVLVVIEGVAIFAYFSSKGCDPLASGQVKNINQIIPFTILELFHDYPGLPGLFIAALAAASLSTISSGLSSLSAITYEDFIKVCLKNIKDETGTKISKAVVVIYGLISVGFAFLLLNVEGPLGQVCSSFMGALGGPGTGLFLISIFFRRAQAKAVILATLTGFGFILWISMGNNFSASVPRAPFLPLGPTDHCPVSYDIYNDTSTYRVTEGLADVITHIYNATVYPNIVTESQISSRNGLQTLYSISYMYYNLIGCIITVVIGSIVSLLTQPKVMEPVNDQVVLPFSIFIPPCLRSVFSRSSSNSDSSDPKELESMISVECRSSRINRKT